MNETLKYIDVEINPIQLDRIQESIYNRNRVVQVFERDVYGQAKLYPANEPARIFCRIFNQKTLTEMNVRLIKELGHEVELVMSGGYKL